MIPEYNRKSLMIGVPGLLIQIGSVALPVVMGARDGGSLPAWVALVWMLGPFVGAVMLIIGLCYYAKAKGYSAVLGLLGLLSCLGLLILAILPDRQK